MFKLGKEMLTEKTYKSRMKILLFALFCIGCGNQINKQELKLIEKNLKQ